LFILKFWAGEPIGDRLWLPLGITTMLASVQLMTVGVLAEMMTRTYFEASKQKSYVIRNEDDNAPETWHSIDDDI